MGDREDYVTCVVLDGRQRGLCYLFMGDRGDYVTCLRKEVYWVGDRED